MKVSELIATLNNILEDNGDLNVQVSTDDGRTYTEMEFWIAERTLKIEVTD